MPQDRHLSVHLPGRKLAQSVALAVVVSGAACGRGPATQTEVQKAPAEQRSRMQNKSMQPDVQLQFRFKARSSFTDIDPPRIEAAIHGLDGVAAFKIFDDRLSDADFVTLVITLRDPDLPRFAALQRALLSISDVRVFAVDASGNATPLEGLAPERLPEVARSNVKL
jgi:hypothetical protein